MRKRRTVGLTLAAERLEDRVLLSAFTVTNLNDSGAGSLRQAVLDAEANGGTDNIVFQAGLSGTILLTGGQMAVTEDLTITGNGRSNTIIDALRLSRFFDVSGAGTDFTIEELTLQNGRTTAGDADGGAIRSLSTGASLLTIMNCTLSGNSTTGDASRGGALFAYYDANDIVVTGSNLTGNFTTGLVSHGGALCSFNGGKVTVNDSTFTGNHVDASDADGGAIYGYTGAVKVTGSMLSDNTSGRRGGAIHIGSSAPLVIHSSTLSSNQASSDGGAISSASDGNVTIINSTLSGNQVLGTPSFGGGAVYFDDGDCTIINSTITNNSANIGGGIGNRANNNGETLTIHNSIIAGNTAATNPDFTAPGNAFGNLRVANSLIGRRDGTTLTADATATFTDAKQTNSYVGGVTPGAAINPNLGPLQDNGGPTFTHALLTGSKAINHGDNALAVDPTNGNAALANDQRGGPFFRKFGIVDMGAFENQPLQIHGTTAYVYGGSTADNIVLRLTPRQVEVNGAAWVLPANIANVEIVGQQSTDTFTLFGTTGDEALRLSPGVLWLDRSGNGLTAHATSVEKISGYRVGGDDLATLNGSTGGDVLTTSPTNTKFTGSGFNQQLSGFGSITADGHGGTDRATLNGDSGADLFTTQSNYATMSGAAYTIRVSDFDRVTASGRGGTSDQANFNGTGSADTFTATASVASLAVPGYFFQGYDFDLRTAVGNGGADVAKLYGTNDVDSFFGFGTIGQLTGVGFTDRVVGFADVRIIGYGGTNRVSLSTGNPIQYVLKKYGVWV